jgi:pyrroline-5-carboxylate reductase
MNQKIAFIGGGNMATALMDGLLAAGAAPNHFLVIEPLDAIRAKHASRGVLTHSLAHTDLSRYGLWVLATKPQALQKACEAIVGFLSPDTVIISIAAGVPIHTLSGWLGGHTKIVRTMPNTPAKVGLGITGLFATPSCSADEKAAADAVFAAAGQRIWLPTEAMLDPITAISGSGPGYVFYFMEAMERAAIELGFAPEQARALAVDTFRGAAQLAAQEDTSLAVLRERVTSKGGTTHAALSYMQAAGVSQSIVTALHQANLRARALAEAGAQ